MNVKTCQALEMEKKNVSNEEEINSTLLHNEILQFNVNPIEHLIEYIEVKPFETKAEIC